MKDIAKLLWAAVVPLALGPVGTSSAAGQVSPAPPLPQAPPPPPMPMAPPAPPSLAGPTPSLRGQSVMIYNFLDVREGEYTKKVIGEIERQLAAALNANGVTTQLVRFNETAVGMTFANSLGGATIPVAEVFRESQPKEAAAGIRYRLVAFPADYLVAGAWRHYVVRWLVVDAATNRAVFRSEYRGRHMVMFKNNEGAENRAKKIVDHVTTALKANAML